MSLIPLLRHSIRCWLKFNPQHSEHLIKQLRQSVWYFHLFAWSDWDSPDTVHVRRVAVGETGRGEVPAAVLQTVSTSLKRQTQSRGQRWFIMLVYKVRGFWAPCWSIYTLRGNPMSRKKSSSKGPKNVILMPKYIFFKQNSFLHVMKHMCF